MAIPNISNPPTDKLLVRQAIQAALDMDEIMDAASDGKYQFNVGFQYPGQPDYTDAGKETYNLHNPDLAKKYLSEAGYQGEPVVLLTNRDYPPMYNSALVMQQELQAVGINAQMKVVDWPTSVQMTLNTTEGWNFYFTGWGTQPALGAFATMQFLVQPNASYKPKDGKDDPDVLAAMERYEHVADAGGAAGGLRPDAEVGAGAGLCHAVRLIHQGAGGPLGRQRFRAVPHTAHGERLVQPLVVRSKAAFRNRGLLLRSPADGSPGPKDASAGRQVNHPAAGSFRLL